MGRAVCAEVCAESAARSGNAGLTPPPVGGAAYLGWGRARVLCTYVCGGAHATSRTHGTKTGVHISRARQATLRTYACPTVHASRAGVTWRIMRFGRDAVQVGGGDHLEQPRRVEVVVETPQGRPRVGESSEQARGEAAGARVVARRVRDACAGSSNPRQWYRGERADVHKADCPTN